MTDAQPPEPRPDPKLAEIAAWFRNNRMDIVLSETTGVGVAFAHVYSRDTDHSLLGFFRGPTLLDAATAARRHFEGGDATMAVPPATATASLPAPNVGDDEAAAIPPKVLASHTFLIQYDELESDDNLWLVRALDLDGNLLAMGLGDDHEDALLDLADKLMPPPAEQGGAAAPDAPDQ